MQLRIKTVLDAAASICMIAASVTLVYAVLLRPPPVPAPRLAGNGDRVPVVNVEDKRLTLAVPADVRHRHPRAQLAIVEFSDFQCPFCARYARDTLAEVKRTYVDSGQVAYMFLNFPLEPLHPLAFKASEAAECAGQQARFWEMHSVLFQNQTALKEENLIQYARTLQLEVPQFQKCLSGSMTDKVTQDINHGKRLGVDSTPTFALGRFRDDRTLEVLRLIRGAVSAAQFHAALKPLLSPAVPYRAAAVVPIR